MLLFPGIINISFAASWRLSCKVHYHYITFKQGFQNNMIWYLIAGVSGCFSSRLTILVQITIFSILLWMPGIILPRSRTSEGTNNHYCHMWIVAKNSFVVMTNNDPLFSVGKRHIDFLPDKWWPKLCRDGNVTVCRTWYLFYHCTVFDFTLGFRSLYTVQNI